MPQQYCYPANAITTSGANVVWYPINANTTLQTTYQSSNLTFTGQVWQQWVNNASVVTTSTSAYTDQVWQTWVIPQQQYAYQTPIHFSEEARRASEAYEAERRQRWQQQEQEQHAARTRARVLLGEFLTDEQKVELERHGRFHVRGSRGRRYCIRTTGQSGNVDLLTDQGEVQARLCAHPGGMLPEGDAWLMQMLEIRHDEDHFLRTANVHRGRLPVGIR